jgi:multimeric flavodoxin WrbA
MTWLIPKMKDADIQVLASPIYVWGVTGPMKIMMDRMVSLVQPFIEESDGKMRHLKREETKSHQTVLVSNCGFWEMDNFDPILAQFQARSTHGNMQFAGALLRPHGPVLREMIELGAPVQDVLEAAREAGRQLVREGAISPELLNTISRPLISKDEYQKIANQQFTEVLRKNKNV